ncbi:MAG TPA: nucleoside triphosphate pyrophosphohydrolase [Chloroflexota bacterium]|nr:nucleoside triphosphate pyrophosphohydrolase [Chloroflexota bacterium]
MGKIAVVGLGPGARGLVTHDAQTAIEDAARDGRLYLRTRVHPLVEDWPALAAAPSGDAHYVDGDTFDQTYERIVSDVLTRSDATPADAELVYAVPGHPLVGEATVRRLRAAASGRGHAVRVVPGLSFVDAALTALAPVAGAELDGEDLRVADGLALGRVDPTVPLLVCQVYARSVASAVKLALAEHYGDEHTVYLIHAAAVPQEERVERLALREIDRRPDVAHLTSLWVPALAPLDALREPATLRDVMARLRAPEPDGCPWDREQTHDSLRRYLLEETYEALDALDKGDVAALQEELGDLLLQIVFHSQIAEEEGDFGLGDVCAAINAKLIRRHPHVFGEQREHDAEVVLRNWEQLKREERAKKDQAERSMLDGVPVSMPALSYSQQVQDRAARVGFDWPDVSGVLDKVAEEARELAEAGTAEERKEELGDLLFVLVRLASWLKLDPEDALRAANRKFRERFSAMEGAARAAGRTLDQYDAAGLDALWRAAKQRPK